jgi:heptosyltransferase-2
VTTPAAVPLLETHPAVARVIPHDKHGSESGAGGIARLAQQLRSNGYRRAYLPHRSWRSGLVAYLAGIPERIGFADAPARWTYTQRIARPRGCHEVERLLALLPGATEAPVSLGLTAGDRTLAENWLIERQVSPGFVAMAPGAVWGTKRWTGYAELLALTDAVTVIIGGPADHSIGESLRAIAPGRIFNACGALPLRASAALLEQASVLITNDSLPMHLAQATATATIAVFGPTVPAFGFGPRGSQDVVVELPGLACRPCSAHGPQVCPLGHHRCMREIEAGRVVKLLDPLLSPRG